jgi:flagellar biosynthesis/type III secretory pathway protein FliH
LWIRTPQLDKNVRIEQFVVVFEQSEDKGASSTLVNWFRQLAIHGRVKPEDYASLAEVYRSVEEVKGMLQSAFKTQQERWYQQGIEKGIEKGREEGIEQGIEVGIEQGREEGIEVGIEKGREEGIEVGIEKGREDAIRRTALAMFVRGIDPVLIADVTGLTEDELNALLTSPPTEDETP